MAKLYVDEARLVACEEDNSVVWSDDGGKWIPGSVWLARDVWLSGERITAEQAAKRFPKADLAGLANVLPAA